ncbi:MAG: glycosyltransferase [Phycisphaerales bacterium]|nr:MAG: glycosyltransferase [Phycisphaerales bacterium]
MPCEDRPIVSFVMATHNRRAVVVRALANVARCGLNQREFEIIVVDNKSSDGTRETIREFTPHLIALDRNAGSCAKAHALPMVRGRYVVFLDDDSYPMAGSIQRMIRHFEQDPGLGAAGFTVHLPDGRRESGALPGVFVGCGVGLRAEALRPVGGLDAHFFMQAEEYDLAFRLAGAGWRVEVFNDLHAEHLKSGSARRSDRTTFYDVRNNVLVAARYLPAPYYRIYRADGLQRYRWLAAREGHRAAYRRGLWAALLREPLDRWAFRRRRLTPAVLERFYQIDTVQRRMQELARDGIRRAVFATLGKNVFAFHRAALLAGIEIIAVGDDYFSARGRFYRGVRLLPMAQALALEADAVVISNMASAQVDHAMGRLVRETTIPIYGWYGTQEAGITAADESNSKSRVADENQETTPAVLTG